VCTRKYPGLEGVKFLWVQPLDVARGPEPVEGPLDEKLRPSGKPLVAADATQAGLGEIVYLEDGREGSYALPTTFVPVDAAVVGHVDEIDCQLENRNSNVKGSRLKR
jgi:ethanolamine utilization protein EutN